MKKIRPTIWSAAALIVATAFCTFRISHQNAQAQDKDSNAVFWANKRAQFRAALVKDRDFNYQAKSNNGGKRSELTLKDLPQSVQAEASKVAKQYREVIYPILTKYAKENGGLLPEGILPELLPYAEDAEYKGTGIKTYGRDSWAFGFNRRMDGTLIARSIYSENSPDEPHDVWAGFNKFSDFPTIGKGFLISGWDDGRVTFDPVETLYFGSVQRGTETVKSSAVPGQAGVTEEATRGLSAWQKKQGQPTLQEQLDLKVEDKVVSDKSVDDKIQR